MTVGIVGLGNMGRAIAERLEEAGERLVVWNRTRARAQGLAAEVCDTPRDVLERADIVLSVLANDEAIDAVYFGADGLCSAPMRGTLVVEMCTTSPAKAVALDRAVQDAGGAFLECPVGGTVGPARQGRLLAMAGGAKDAFARARPLLETLSRRVEHMGPAGTGAAMKLAINLPLMVYWGALGEALSLALKQGIDPARALDILSDSSGAIGAAKTRVPPIREMLLRGEPGAVNFALTNAIKDMRLMEAVAAETGRDSPVIAAARAAAETAAAEGFADLDCSMYGLRGQKTPE